MKRIAFVLALLSFGVFLLAGTATATFTTILPAPGSEVSLDGPGGILDQIYGLGNLQRVDDEGVSPNDQMWFNPDAFSATAQAKYAGFDQNFGYIPDLGAPGFDDDSFVPLFPVTGNGINLGAPTASLSSGPFNFLWALDPSGAPLWTSEPSQNDDGIDHMVTWLITGNSGKPGNIFGNWVIGWEDLPQGGDRDFNDLVVEVGHKNPVPEPTTMLLLGVGLIGLVGFRRKFKK